MSKRIQVVVIGGGTGAFSVLSGLKKYNRLSITTIVSSADDGGSNKKFRDEFGLLPPSDFRQCLVALSSDYSYQASLRKLLMYRFPKGVGLEGQTFGNILIAALTDIEGSQLKALEEVEKILNIKGKIYPITTDNIRLMAEYENKEIVFGEHLIDEPEEFHDPKLRIKRLFLNRKARAYPKAIKAIREADFIVLGPGDLYTSTLANVIVGHTAGVIKRSKAKFVYIVNLMTKYGQTYRFTGSDHVRELVKYIKREPDFILINNAPLPKKILGKYKKEKNDTPVQDDIKGSHYKIIRDDFLLKKVMKKEEADHLYRSLIRHDDRKLGKTLHQIMTSSVDSR